MKPYGLKSGRANTPQLFRTAVVASGFFQVLISPCHDSPGETERQLRGPKKELVYQNLLLDSARGSDERRCCKARKVLFNCIQNDPLDSGGEVGLVL